MYAQTITITYAYGRKINFQNLEFCQFQNLEFCQFQNLEFCQFDIGILSQAAQLSIFSDVYFYSRADLEGKHRGQAP